MAYKGDEPVGALPYIIKRRLGMTIITQPPLTQTLGPWLRPSNAKYSNALSHEKDILEALASGLPAFSRYQQNWHHSRKDWLPFYWMGYEQTTRYTYQTDLTQNLDQLWNETRKDVRGNIRKARERFGITIRESNDISELIPVLENTFERQDKSFPMTEEFLKQLDRAAAAQGKRAILLAEDPTQNIHAGTYIVWEGNVAYQLLNGYDVKSRQSGAGALCVWNAIQKASSFADVYDFEGSMLEPVERFFRAFGGRQVPYFRVTRTDSTLLRMAHLTPFLKTV